MDMFCPSLHPSLLSANRIPSIRADSLAGLVFERYPIRGTFLSFFRGLFFYATVSWNCRVVESKMAKEMKFKDRIEKIAASTQFENGYVLIIFEHAAPRFFLEKEIAPDLLGKLRAIEIEQFYSVLCIHSFFRDDWQERYDAEHTVSNRLLNIRETQGKEFVAIP